MLVPATGVFTQTITKTTLYVMTNTSGKVLHSQVFQKYLTESWAKASSYSWQKSNTTAISFSGTYTQDITDKAKAAFGLTASRTTTYSVAITLPADSSKFSKSGISQIIIGRILML